MTDFIDPSTLFTATDGRRAAALLTHYQAGDYAGLHAILAEAHEADESVDLAAAVVALFFQLSPELMTDKGGEALRELTRAWAAFEAEDLAGGQ
jgi:hypothetical protein